MITGPFVDAIITIATDNDLTPAVDLGRPWDTLLIVIPTITSSTVFVMVAEKSGGTYQNLYVTDPTDGSNSQVVAGTSTGAFTWIVPLGGFQFVKIATGTGQGANRTFRIAGRRS